MPSIPLNTFLNFTAARGTARVAAATLPRNDYDPRKDYYKRLREHTVRQFIEGSDAGSFPQTAQRLAGPRKEASFAACSGGLNRWAQDKRISARRAPRQTWTAAGLEVRVNPELRLDVDGQPFVAKLHFKVDQLDDTRRDNLLCLLAETAPTGVGAAILDARRAQLLTAEMVDPDRDALLLSEAAAFMALLAACEQSECQETAEQFRSLLPA